MDSIFILSSQLFQLVFQRTEIENLQSVFPVSLESQSVKIPMGHRNVDCNQFSSWTSPCLPGVDLQLNHGVIIYVGIPTAYMYSKRVHGGWRRVRLSD